MKQVIKIESDGYELRPLKPEDSKWLLELRQDPEISKYINSTDHTVESHAEWIKKNAEKQDDYYFVIQDYGTKQPHGVVALYDIKYRSAEWGRWVLKPGSIAAAASVYLVIEAAKILNMTRIYSRTVADNKKVCRFHDLVGAKFVKVLENYATINGKTYNSMLHEIEIGQHSDKVQENLEKFLL